MKLKATEVREIFWVALLLLGVTTFAIRWGVSSELDRETIFILRFPRVLLALASGAALAFSGCLLQALFRNPLCEPYTLGVSSGAAFGAVLGHSLGLSQELLGISLGGLSGAMLVALVLILLGRFSKIGTSQLLLVGVMLTFTGSSLVALWIALQDTSGMQSMLGWLLGDLSRADLRASLLLLGVLCGVMVVMLPRHREYDVLWLGEDEARTLGIDVRRTRNRIVIFTSLLVGFSVASAGMIGFLGLIVPHFLRLSGSARHLRVLPLSILWGAILLVLSDFGARVVAAPYEIPVGVITALVGAPLFIFFLFRRRTI